MNEPLEKMTKRHAIRRFQSRQIDEETLNEILTVGLYAPSAGNNQQSRIVVCQDGEINEKLGRLSCSMQFEGRDRTVHSLSADQPSILDDVSITDGFYGAPTVLTIFTSNNIYSHDDAAFVAANIWHAANFLGVGCCYIGRAEKVFATEYGMELRKKWGVPDELVPVANVLLGYREGAEPHDKPRREGRIIRVMQEE